jgi:hypothetical protein
LFWSPTSPADYGERLIEAAKEGDVTEMRRLIAAGANKDHAGPGVCVLTFRFSC